MTPAPTLGSFGTLLYDTLSPLAYDDANQGYALCAFAGAMGSMFDDIYDLAMGDDDRAGWSTLVDLDACPDYALDWLGQFKGVRLVSSYTPAVKRTLIEEASGIQRGRPSAITAAIQRLLTGDKTVLIRERYDVVNQVANAWHIQIRTLSSETPDPDAVEALLRSGRVLPAGLVLHYDAITGQDWLDLRTNYATWADVFAAYDTWADVIADTP